MVSTRAKSVTIDTLGFLQAVALSFKLLALLKTLSDDTLCIGLLPRDVGKSYV